MPINPMVGGALISGASSLLGGLWSNHSNAGESHAQRQWAAEQNHMDRAWQQHMTDYVNEYNTPANQRARLESAGLNPYMMFDTGNTGTSVAASGAVLWYCVVWQVGTWWVRRHHRRGKAGRTSGSVILPELHRILFHFAQ